MFVATDCICCAWVAAIPVAMASLAQPRNGSRAIMMMRNKWRMAVWEAEGF